MNALFFPNGKALERDLARTWLCDFTRETTRVRTKVFHQVIQCFEFFRCDVEVVIFVLLDAIVFGVTLLVVVKVKVRECEDVLEVVIFLVFRFADEKCAEFVV